MELSRTSTRTFALTLCTLLALAVSQTQAQYPNDNSPLGMNIADIADYGTNVVYTDFFKMFRGWEDGSGTVPAAQLDSNGWIRYLNAGQVARAGYGAGTGGRYPSGVYTCLYDGEGTIDGFMNTVVVTRAPGRITFRVDTSASSSDIFGIAISSVNPANYVRNIRFITPGFESTYEQQPFHPDFLERLSRFRVLRFMDWGATNNSDAVEWTDVKPAGFGMQSSSDRYYGDISPAWMARLCNTLNADGWFCMPHEANDNCVRQYATLVRDSLASGLKVYVEYSNECWNWMFGQTGYCNTRGAALSLPNPGPAEYYALRSAQIWQIFEEVFGAQADRLVRVCSWQQGGAAFEYMYNDIFDDSTYNPTGQMPDVLATAPYITADLPIASMTYDQFFDSVLTGVLPAKRLSMEHDIALARARGIPMVAYEGGQHFVGSGTAAVNYYIGANKHPRMKEVYLQYLQDWFDAGGSMFCHFSSCAMGGQYGSWGAVEYYNQPRAAAPKYDALMTFIEDSIGTVSAGHQPLRVALQPGPAFGGSRVMAFLLSGRLVPGHYAAPGVPQPGLGGLAHGAYAVGRLGGADLRIGSAR